MATISNTPRPGYVWDATDNCWYPIGTGPHSHADYITSGSAINPNIVDAKGDIIAATAADTVARLAVGSNDQVLTADSSTATGLKWATPSSGAGNMVQIATGTLSGATVTLSSLSSYSDLFLIVYDTTNNTADGRPYIRINGNTGSNYTTIGAWQDGTNTPTQTKIINGTYAPLADENINRTSASQSYTIRITNTKTTGFTTYNIVSFFTVSTRGAHYAAQGIFTNSATVSSLDIGNLGGTWSAGTYTLWGA
jgi:hypothetical protein